MNVPRLARASIFFGAAVAFLEIAPRVGLWHPAMLPPPSDVGAYLVQSFADGSMLVAILDTMRRLGIGYALGLVFGLPAGFLSARFRTASDTLGLVALGFQTLPSVCWVIPATVWFGMTELSMIFVVVMGTVWSILLATEHGVRSVSPVYVRAGRTMGAKNLSIVFRVLLPASLPYIVSGMKQGWAFAWRSLMAAEIYVAVAEIAGLGYLLDEGRDYFLMDQAFGVMFVVVLVGLLADRLLFSPFERFLHRRWGTGA